MLKFSLELVSLLVISLSSLVRPENDTDHDSKKVTSTSTTEKIDYLNLEPAILCKFQPNGYDCDGSRKVTPKFYYDLKLEDCKTFNIGTCPKNLNAYDTMSECHAACRDVGTHIISRKLSERIFCHLQYDFGYCNDYHPRWYYDVTSQRCRGFSYSGCGGNLNRFKSQQGCTATCVPVGQSGYQ